MLTKLLKYDLKNVFKVLNIFYILAIFFGLLTRLLFSFNNSFILNIIAQICSGITISMFLNIIINNLMRLWVRYKNNFYSDESYLTHTLPVTKNTLYASKIFAAVITLFVSVIVIAITVLITYYSKDNIELIKNILLPVANIYNSSITGILIAFFFVFFLEFANALQIGYTGIILGHKMNNAKTGFSVLYGFLSYLVLQGIILIVLFIFSFFNNDIMKLFITSEVQNIAVIKEIIILSLVLYTITFIINYFVNIKLFNKGVNVD